MLAPNSVLWTANIAELGNHGCVERAEWHGGGGQVLPGDSSVTLTVSPIRPALITEARDSWVLPGRPGTEQGCKMF